VQEVIVKRNHIKAFPRTNDCNQLGMDLRDYFAAHAMKEMFDAGWIDSGMIEEVDLDNLAKWSYIMADVMLKARDENNQSV